MVAVEAVRARQGRVKGAAATLRTTAGGSAGKQLAVLPRGHRVLLLGAPQRDWWQVSTTVKGAQLDGWLPVTTVEPVPVPRGLPKVDLDSGSHSITRNSGSRAYPLNEASMPRVAAGAKATVAEIGRIIDWLDVESSSRYQRIPGGSTYCNIYAYDYVYLAGGGIYLPRVWWTGPSVSKLRKGETVEVKYGKTVYELGANPLFDWLNTYSAEFGWRRVDDLTEAQRAANDAKMVVMCGKRTDLDDPGHIVAVVPETGEHKAARDGNVVKSPLQSQAGAHNHKYFASNWGTGSSWLDRGCWVHN